MEFALLFFSLLVDTLWLGFPFFCSFILAITFLGLWVGKLEGWTRFDSVYWAFITALTVGYGDFRPSTRGSKALALLTAIIGIMFTGVLVAMTVAVASEAFKQFMPTG